MGEIHIYQGLVWFPQSTAASELGNQTSQSHDPIRVFLIPCAVIFSNLFQLNVKESCCSTGSVKHLIAGLTGSEEEHLTAPSGSFSSAPQGPCKKKDNDRSQYQNVKKYVKQLRLIAIYSRSLQRRSHSAVSQFL